MRQFLLTPAHGRDYKSSKALLEDFRAGKDFKVEQFGEFAYANLQDLPVGTSVIFRYKALRQVYTYTVTEKDKEGKNGEA